MRAGLYLAVRYYTRYFALSLGFSLLAPLLSGLLYAVGWVTTEGRADLDKFLYQMVGLVLLMVAQMATSSFLWELYNLMAGGQLEYLLASPTHPLLLLVAYYVVQLAVFGSGFALSAAVVVAAIKGLAYGIATLLSVFIAAALSLPLIGITLALAYLLPSLRDPSPITSLLNVGVVFFGGVLYPASILPEALQLISALLPFATWAEFVKMVALNLQAPIRLLGPIGGYMLYFALGVFIWSILIGTMRAFGRYYV
ncbi:ABC-2 type transport system, membrane protein [Pyrobaculum aerophilum str. IM2]|uniref:ABC-2 type transport system, membrane protein n=1 Tax=Pyrobaculum aerophilum (strain ATCC 51768 / DSM 7523 / JCM 9630 / CIP 104966 / NBRC 100827 / IM2) TaxID=178306 RepID=Q8ZTW2_PYRAE|nr:ABC transporter permease [Pyrobaculum aerophilum]AAL64647.1 ABC-2 type transport system, membrane protein [Pyrobaculum aerophilum str. IM2]